MHTTLPALTEPELAAALRGGTGTDHTYTAAVDILLGLPGQMHDRDDIRTNIHLADDGTAWVDWSTFGLRLRRHEIPLSSGERRMLALACSLGSTDVEVSLAQVLVGLDRDNAMLVMSALRTAVGLAVDPLLYEREPEETGSTPVPAGVEGIALTGRRCRRCGTTTGIRLLIDPLGTTWQQVTSPAGQPEWECDGGCAVAPDGGETR